MTDNTLLPRQDIPKADCWDLTPLFKSAEDWNILYSDLETRINDYQDYAGTLNQNFDQFRSCIEFDHRMGRDLEKVYTYAHLRNDEDKTDAFGDELFQRAVNLYTRVLDASSFIVPEIQAIPEDTLNQWTNDPLLSYPWIGS